MTATNPTDAQLAEIREVAWKEGQNAGTVGTLTSIRDYVSRTLLTSQVTLDQRADVVLRDLARHINDRLRAVQP